MTRSGLPTFALVVATGCWQHGLGDEDAAIWAQMTAPAQQNKAAHAPRVASPPPEESDPPATVGSAAVPPVDYDRALAELTAASRCATDLKPSLCANDDAPKARACLDKCIAAIEQGQRAAATAAESSCESRLNEGKGPLACGLVTLPPAIKKAFETHPFVPDTVLQFGRTLVLVDDFDTLMQGGDSLLGRSLNQLGGKGAAQKFRQVLSDAQGPWDVVTLDAAFARWIPLVLQLREALCTETCNAHGRAEKEGPGLVHAYKLCMVAADSTPEARKLNAYEIDLYCDYIRKANSRCRASNRCDWLESYSDLQCTYASPGVDCGL